KLQENLRFCTECGTQIESAETDPDTTETVDEVPVVEPVKAEDEAVVAPDEAEREGNIAQPKAQDEVDVPPEYEPEAKADVVPEPEDEVAMAREYEPEAVAHVSMQHEPEAETASEQPARRTQAKSPPKKPLGKLTKMLLVAVPVLLVALFGAHQFVKSQFDPVKSLEDM